MSSLDELKYLFDNMDIPLIMCGPDHKIRYANRAFAQYSGFSSPRELCGTKWDEFVPPDEIPHYTKLSSDIREGVRERIHFKTKLHFGDITRSVSGTSVLIPGADITVVTFLDKTNETKAQEMVTQRLARESAVCQSLASLLCGEDIKASLESALERIASTIGAEEGFVFTFDDQMQYADIVGLWSRPEKTIDRNSLLRMPLEKFPWWISRIKSGGVVSIMDSEDLPPEASELKELLDKFQVRSLLVFPFRITDRLSGFAGFGDLDKGEMLFEEDFQLLDTFAQAVKGSMDLRLTREESEKRRLHLDNLFNYSSEGVLFSNTSHSIIRANPAFLEMFGYTEEEVIGRNVDELVAGRPKLLKEAQSITNGIGAGASFEGETQRTKKDGTLIDVHVSVATYPVGPFGEGRYAIYRDISTRKEAERHRDRAIADLRGSLEKTVKIMVKIVETRDPYTAGHQERVGALARDIAQKMGLTSEDMDKIYLAGLVHDVGKVFVPGEILSKPGRLNKMEFDLIRNHPRAGYDILHETSFDPLIEEIVFQHHERLDGSGYPRGLKGDEILPEARIVAVADVMEAVSSYRPYRPALGVDKGLEILREGSGTLFDEKAVTACVALFEEDGYELSKAAS